jgi:hypothetical protein
MVIRMDKRDVPIASPCGLDWRKMTPTGGGRFCGDCKKVVRDVSGMSEEEARALLLTPRRENLCVRYLHDKHGNIVFAQPSALLPASLLARAKRVAAVAALPFATQACDAVSSMTEDDDIYESMGGMEAPNDPQPLVTGDAADAGHTDAKSDGRADASPDGDPDFL